MAAPAALGGVREVSDSRTLRDLTSLRPSDAVPVEFLVLAYPIGLPPPGDPGPDGAAGDDPADRDPS